MSQKQDYQIPKAYQPYFFGTVAVLFSAFIVNSYCNCFYNLYSGYSFLDSSRTWLMYYFVYIIYSLSLLKIIDVVGFKVYFENKYSIVFDKSIFLKNKKIDLFILFVVCLHFLGVYFDVTSIKPSNPDLKYFSKLLALLQPYFLVLIYLYYYFYNKNKIYYLILIIYIFSALYSGFFLGLVFYILPLIYYQFKKIKSTNKKFLIITLFCLFLIIYKILKWTTLNGVALADIPDFIQQVQASGTQSESYPAFGVGVGFVLRVISGIISRFDLVSSMTIYDLFFGGQFEALSTNSSLYPIFQGYLGSLIYKIIYGGHVDNINHVVNYLLYGERNSYIFFPLPSYFLFGHTYGILVSLYALMLVVVGFKICSFLPENYNIKILFSIVLYITLIPGWFWALSNFLQALILFIVALKIAGKSNNILKVGVE